MIALTRKGIVAISVVWFLYFIHHLFIHYDQAIQSINGYEDILPTDLIISTLKASKRTDSQDSADTAAASKEATRNNSTSLKPLEPEKVMIQSEKKESTVTSSKPNAIDMSGITNKTDETPSNSSSSALLPVCLMAPFMFQAKTCNKILQIANIVELARRRKCQVGLSPEWTEFYDEWFDPYPNLILRNYTIGPKTQSKRDNYCRGRYSGMAAHYMRDKHTINPSLTKLPLLPKYTFRQAANDAIRTSGYAGVQMIETAGPQDSNTNKNDALLSSSHYYSFISVHRRTLEGQCHSRVKANNTFCTAEGKYSNFDFCDIQYQDVVAFLNDTSHKHDKNNGSDHSAGASASLIPSTSTDENIVLFTDGSSLGKKFDRTFPIIDQQPFPVQMWMMVLSATHFGNTASSVDYIIHHWRQGRQMQPRQCWPPISPNMTSPEYHIKMTNNFSDFLPKSVKRFRSHS